MAFSETTDGRFIIGTSVVSRKAGNIHGDPRVAMVVTDTEQRYTVQIEGQARLLEPDEFEQLADT